MDRIAAMQLARAEAEDYLRTALALLEESAEDVTREQAARTHGLVISYVQLAGEAVNRFQWAAANGA